MTGAHPSETLHRRRRMLRTAMGPEIAAALRDPRVIEIMVNPDGALRLDLLGEGRVDTGTRIGAGEVERIVRLVASHAATEVHGGAPIVSAELPEGERFEGLLPPIVANPCFAIRKPALRIHHLLDYVAEGIMTAEAARSLSMAVTHGSRSS